MYVRLGFAVSVHTDPEVLLVDEVLAVGDDAYQRKCLGKVAELQDRGTTIVFVTHALDLVPQVCHRAVVLDRGRLAADGDPITAAATLRRRLGDGPGGQGSDGPRIGELRVLDPAIGTTKTAFRPGEPLAVEVLVADRAGAQPVAATIELLGPADVLVSAAGPALVGGAGVRFTVATLPALRGEFTVAASLQDPTTGAVRDARRLRDAFRVDGPDTGGILQVAWTAAQPGPVPVASRSGRP
jgi:ABC-2 type transport system ATP-binding protein